MARLTDPTRVTFDHACDTDWHSGRRVPAAFFLMAEGTVVFATCGKHIPDAYDYVIRNYGNVKVGIRRVTQ